MKCELCHKETPKPLRRIPVKKGKETVILNVCSECFNAAV